MLDKIRTAAMHISEAQSKMREAAEELRSLNFEVSDQLEKNLFYPVSLSNIEGDLCAVDGGLLAQEFHGVDLIISQAAAVNFTYESSRLAKTEYFPKSFPEPKYEVKIGLDEHEILAYRSLFRLDLEISSAISAVERFSPKAILLDGSIVPLMTDKPAENNDLFESYSSLISKYIRLYDICSEKGTFLIGVTKDSRGRRFMDTVGKELSKRWPDSLFLNQFLHGNERTFSMNYSASPSKHPILKDLGKHKESINLFYLKCSEDRPLRVEFLNPGTIGKINEIASLVLSLSVINPNYAYPAILIEADLRAAMDPNELERAKKSLLSFSGFQPLRRNSRPFR